MCGPEILQDSVDGIGAQLVIPDRVIYPDVTVAQQGSEQSALDEMMFGLEGARSIATTLYETGTDVAVVDCMQFGALVASVGSRDTDSSVSSHALRLLHGASVCAVHRRLDWSSARKGPRGVRAQCVRQPPFHRPPDLGSRTGCGLDAAASTRVRAHRAGCQRRPRWAAVPRIPQPSRPPATRPKILVSFSTTMMDQSEVIGRVVNALGSLEVDGLVTLGGVAIDLPTPPETSTSSHGSTHSTKSRALHWW